MIWTPHAALAAHSVIHDDVRSQSLSIVADARTKPICPIRVAAQHGCAPVKQNYDFKRSISGMKRNLLFLRPVRRTNMLVTQIPQHLPVIFAHPAREVRIIQMSVARRLRHILQHAQPVLNGPLPVRRQLLPPGQHIIPNVTLLLRREPLPILCRSLHLLLLLRRQLVELSLIFRQPISLLRTHIPQTILHVRRRRGRRLLPVGILRTIVSIACAVVVRARIRIPRRTIIVRPAPVRGRWLPPVRVRWLTIVTAVRSLRSRCLRPPLRLVLSPVLGMIRT